MAGLIRLIGIGKIREKFYVQAAAEYERRLGAYACVEHVRLPDEPAPESLSEAAAEAVKAREGERLLKASEGTDALVALHPAGDMFTSDGLAGWLDRAMISGRSRLAFVIGGSLGLSDQVLRTSDLRWSLSPLTLPHQMVPLIVLEQLYRAQKILRGEPYHK